jgi:hypothetical protein
MELTKPKAIILFPHDDRIVVVDNVTIESWPNGEEPNTTIDIDSKQVNIMTGYSDMLKCRDRLFEMLEKPS